MFALRSSNTSRPVQARCGRRTVPALGVLALFGLLVVAIASPGPTEFRLGGELLAATTVGAASQELNLEDFPKHDPKDLPDNYRKWIEEEVRWIITEEERDVFLRLDTDEKRKTFVEEYWRHRDPTPGTAQNEYRDLHYERFDYATHNFGRDTPRPGWRTDKGKMWILLGEPRDITRLPNTSLAQPVEVWFYGVDPKLGVPPFFYLLFFKDRGVGEYRLYSPLSDGPERLLNPSGLGQAQRLASQGFGGRGGTPMTGFGNLGAQIDTLREVDPQLATAAISLIPGGGAAQMGMSPLRSEMMLTQIFDLPNRIMPTAAYAYRVLAGFTESNVRFETLPLKALVTPLLDPSGVPFLHYIVRSPGDRLNLNRFEDKYYVTFEISTSLTDSNLRALVDPEGRQMEADLDADSARRLRTGNVHYMERLPVVPGRYDFALIVENNVTREFGRLEFDVEIPEPFPATPRASQPILALESQLIPSYDPFDTHFPFQVGANAMLPALDGPFASGGVVHIFRQIYAPRGASDQLLASYQLLDSSGATVVERIIRVDLAEQDRFGVVNHRTEVGLADVPAGEYVLRADLEMVDDGAVELRVVVIPAEGAEMPFVHAGQHPPPTDPGIRLVRARQFRTIGETDAAIAELESVLERQPDFVDALDLQVELLTDAGRFEEISSLLSPMVMRSPNDPKLLATLADANARLGEHFEAIRYYERARLGDADNTEILNLLAAEYFAEGRLEKAQELLRQSLGLEPNQPDIKRILDDMASRIGSEASQ